MEVIAEQEESEQPIKSNLYVSVLNRYFKQSPPKQVKKQNSMLSKSRNESDPIHSYSAREHSSSRN